MTAEELFKKMMKGEKVKARHPISKRFRKVTLYRVGLEFSQGYDIENLLFSFTNKNSEEI